MATREPTVAGQFYPKDKTELEKQVRQFLENAPESEKSPCVITPHAGYAYSGKTAAYSFNALKEAKTFAILSPNHTGIGKPTSISNTESWTTPLGKTEIDTKKRNKLLEKLGIEGDNLAHLGEHSIEVQLPFIQTKFPKAKIIPITIMEHDYLELKKLGETIAELEEISVIASGDFTHFEPLETAKKKDMGAIKFIEKLDVKGFYDEVTSKKLSICGLAPITTAMHYYCYHYKKMDPGEGRLLKYETSAETTGDRTSVVGYASISFH